jgi:MFS transporter, DHA1 family, inner membrane transport protein
MAERRSTAAAVGALLALAVAAFTYVTTETLPIGLLLPMTADLGVSPSAVGLLVTYYGLVVVVASLPLTHLTRRVPRRLLLSGLLAVFVWPAGCRPPPPATGCCSGPGWPPR